MNRELLERRTRMLKLSIQGVRLKDIIDTLTEDFKCKAKSLYEDWRRRNQWIPQILQFNDPTLLPRLLEGMRLVIPKAWMIAESSENDFCKLKALQLIENTHADLIKALQSIGVVEKRPLQIEQRPIMIRGRWWLMDQAPVDARKNLQDEVKQALEQEGARQAEGDNHKRCDEGSNIPVS
jgi:hypothetical protein